MEKENFDEVWGDITEKIPTESDKLSSYWYVADHLSDEIKFKFEFDSPDSVS